jgi:hypothetical protein
VAGPAAKVVGVDPTALATDTGATVQTDTTVIALAVTGPTPHDAYANAVAVTNAFVTAITALETTPGSAPRVKLSVITDPGMPAVRVLPAMPVWVAGGVLLVPAVALLIAELLRWLYPRWTSSGEIPRPIGPRRPPPSANGLAPPDQTDGYDGSDESDQSDEETTRIGPVPEPARQWPGPATPRPMR